MSLSSKLKQSGFDPAELDKPVWDGPSSNSPQGGVTSSLLSRYLVCRERFRITTIEGLKPVDSFSPRMEYGSMWHACEESLAANKPWEKSLADYARQLAQRYPTSGEQVVHWMNICKVQFPSYVDWWKHHPDVKKRTPIVQEERFSVPLKLASGRICYLRGKWDSVDVIQDRRDGELYLQENKTKADIDAPLLQRQLQFDLQTGVYSIALQESFLQNKQWKGLFKKFKEVRFAGVRYNVIRRPCSGGKGSIRQKKNQTAEEYYEELRELISGAIGPEWGMAPGDHYFFMRWKVDFSSGDVERFRRECLEPVLENLLDDYEWWNFCRQKDWYPFDSQSREVNFPNHRNRHYRLPFGIYNPLAEGGASEVDEYLATGSTAGLVRPDTLFPELQ